MNVCRRVDLVGGGICYTVRMGAHTDTDPTTRPAAGNVIRDGRTIANITKTADNVTITFTDGSEPWRYSRWDFDNGMLDGIVRPAAVRGPADDYDDEARLDRLHDDIAAEGF